jgi:PhzF family phenazine biosynthesis protein
MRLPYYEVAAFTTAAFGGNPAGVCLLAGWLADAVLQQIAANNKLSETAFLVPRGAEFELRWFTPTTEVDLCGHATLAAAAVLWGEGRLPEETVRFQSRSGVLPVTRQGDVLTLDFPSRPPFPIAAPAALSSGLRATPREVHQARDCLALLASEAEVRALRPDFALLKTLDCLGIIATAPGTDCDFVSRFFAPRAGIDEDPVTGSAHCTLIPFWAARLGKTTLSARQLSLRGGVLDCELVGDRVRIGGRAVLYLRGEIELPAPA